MTDIELTSDQVRWFAEISGDVNPLHVDEAHARMTPFGRPVAHGALVVLSCLAALPPRSGRLTSLDVAFPEPVFPDRTYSLSVQSRNDDAAAEERLSVTLLDGRRVVLELEAVFDTEPWDRSSPAEPLAVSAQRSRESSRSVEADELRIGLRVEERYSCDSAEVDRLIQTLGLRDRGLSAAHVQALAWCSYTAGMEVPGRSALIARITITFAASMPHESSVVDGSVEVAGLHQGLGVLDLNGRLVPANADEAGPWAEAEMRVRVRPEAPVTTVERITRLMPVSDRLAGTVAVVIGGSRGLGAATVQALASQGCMVYLVHHRSSDAAVRLRGAMGSLKDNVILKTGDCTDAEFCSDLHEEIRRCHGRLDFLVLNASPALREEDLDAEGGRRLLDYVDHSLAMAQVPLAALSDLVEDAGGSVVGISSEAVQRPVDGWAHYVTAKHALEGLLRALPIQQRSTGVLIVRPPRLRTSLTHIPVTGDVLPPEDVAVTLVRTLLDGSTGPEAVTILETFEVNGSMSTPVPADAHQQPGEPDGGPERERGKVQVAATFTGEPVVPALAWWMERLDLGLTVELSPYAQVLQELLDPNSAMARNTDGVNVLLVRLSDWATGDLVQITNDLVAAVDSFSRRSNVPLIVMLCPSTIGADEDADGIIDECTALIHQALASVLGVHVLTTDAFGPRYVTSVHQDPERDRLAHIPFTEEGFAGLATAVARAVRAIRRDPAKVLVLDADNTLWRGVCGEDGPHGVVIDTPYQQLQRWVLELRSRGVLLCLASKNLDPDVRETMARDDMLIKAEHFAAERVNWQPKSANIRDMISELNLGLDSVVFLDDNPAEIAEVAAALPQVFCVTLPHDVDGMKAVLEHTWAFDQLHVTDEDRNRVDRYRGARARDELRHTVLDYATFIRELGLRIDIRKARPDDYARVSQMTYRTNQFNTTGLKLDQNDVAALEERGWTCWVGEVSDRFGDYGLTCVAVTSRRSSAVIVENLLMSCRVLGKGVEHAVVAQLGLQALADGATTIEFPLVYRPRNEPVRNFLASVTGECREVNGPDETTSLLHELTAQKAAAVEFSPQNVADQGLSENPSDAKESKQAVPNDRFLGLAGIPAELATAAQISAEVVGTRVDSAHQGSGSVASARSALRTVIAAFAKVLRRPPGEFVATTRLEDIGLTSMLMVDLTVDLENEFGRLPSTLLFENDTLGDVADAVSGECAEPQERTEEKMDPVPIGAPSSGARGPAPESHSGDLVAHDREPVAIVGLAGRYPGARNVDELWDVLRRGENQVQEVPASRWDHDSYVDETGKDPGATYSRWGCFVDGVAEFDSLFFKTSPREAALMDPQQRLFLQTAYAAVQDAGHRPTSLGARVGVYVGAMAQDYGVMTASAALEGRAPLAYAANYQIANRVSYCLNFSGPSINVDTACSSSGVALHLACQDLRDGKADAAIAGGVNLVLHPSRYVQYAQMGMLSRTGACHAFGAQADGMVMGEGVGAVVLKPLTAAERDGDHIYGVIRGTAVNSAGHTQGFTVPSPGMQAELVQDALQDAGLGAESVNLIEAHGTGTPLGDPIEIRGLAEAFQDSGLGQGTCAVSSAKSVIGHLEPAAAIAGLTKVLLQLKHRTVLPSLGAEETNPKIDFAATPFYVPTVESPWSRDETPRIAGISSFGAGGVNAHVIVEERPLPAVAGPTPRTHDELVLVSARTRDQLLESAARLRDHLMQPTVEPSLADVAHTLRVGREPLEHRVAVVVSNVDALVEALGEIVDDGPDGVTSAACWAAAKNGTQDAAGLSSVLSEEAGADFLRTLGRGDDLDALATLWTNGVDIDWASVLPRGSARRVALPTYPFARPTHWIPGAQDAGSSRLAAQRSAVQHGESPGSSGSASGGTVRDADEGVADLVFDGTEPWLRDHVIQGRRTVPAVVYLDMMLRFARRRIASDEGAAATISSPAVIDKVVWAETLTVDDATLEVVARAVPKEGRPAPAPRFTMTFERDGSGPAAATTRAGVEPTVSDERSPQIPALTEAEHSSDLTTKDVYRTLAERGMEYGPALRGVEVVHIARGAAESTVAIPADAGWGAEHYLIHPAVLDGALQSAVVGSGLAEAYLPYTLGECWVSGRGVGDTAQVRVRYRRQDASMLRCDIEVISDHGQLVAALSDLVLLSPSNRQAAPINAYRAVWSAEEDLEPVADTSQPENPSHVAVLSSDSAHVEIWRELEEVGRLQVVDAQQLGEILDDPGAAVLVVDYRPACQYAGEKPDWMQTVHGLATQVLRGQAVATYLSVTGPEATDPAPVAAAAFGLAAGKESARFRSTRVEVDPDGGVVPSPEDLLGEWRRGDAEVAYQASGSGSGRTVRRFERVAFDDTSSTRLRHEGHYVVSGGGGGIGRRLGAWLARTYGANVLLLGRSPEPPWSEGQAPDFGSGSVTYTPCDVTNQVRLEEVLEQSRVRNGPLHGVFHAAGVIDDSPLLRKSPAECRNVLGPKVTGVQVLDGATAQDPLDVFVLMSSTAGTLGNAGQCDYAMANRFLDAFADQRFAWVREGRRRGHTVSIAWPLWRDGGMTLNAAVETSIQDTTGFAAIRSTDAFTFLEQALALDAPVLVAAHGDDSAIQRSLLRRPSARPARGKQPEVATSEPASAAARIDEGMLQEVLFDLAVTLLQISRDDIDEDVEFSEVGFDSVLYASYSHAINERLGTDVSPAAFFDHRTIGRLVDHLLAEHQSAVSSALSGAEDERGAPAVTAPESAVSETAVSDTPNLSSVVPLPATGSVRPPTATSEDRWPAAAEAPGSSPSTIAPIAVVGVAGRLPGADDLDTFWDNLVTGRDSVTEVPADRWDWQRYDPRVPGEPGTTHCRWGGFLSDVDGFDAGFFRITGREAQLMDPQQRLFLEAAWTALEDSGRDPRGLGGSQTGVFAGVSLNDYLHRLQESGVQPTGHLATGNVHSVVPNRVSHLLDLRGPSEAIDTACSSSLVALHRAVGALRTGECDMALVGGVNALLSPLWYVSFDHAGMLSRRGRCATFDAQADGYVRGEGVGAVVLRPLDAALAAGDTIHGLISGTAVAHGGHAHSLTAPSPSAQADVIAAAQRQAGTHAPLSYIETHGTGTHLGDPVEVEGLRLALSSLGQEGVRPASRVHLGALKTAIGHLESASGIAGLIKVLLAMRHRRLPGNLHLTELNPHVTLSGTPMHALDRTEDWNPVDDKGDPVRRKAGLSSFGFGGVNAHVVIEEPPAESRTVVRDLGTGTGDFVAVLSAASQPQLVTYARRIGGSLRDRVDVLDPADVVYTLRTGRPVLEHRLAVVAGTVAEMAKALLAFADGVIGQGVYQGTATNDGQKAAPENASARDAAAHWVNGGGARLAEPATETRRPCRVSLPTYPFDRVAHAPSTPFGPSGSDGTEHPDSPAQPGRLASADWRSGRVDEPADHTGERSALVRPSWVSAELRPRAVRDDTAPLTVVVLASGMPALDVGAALGALPGAKWILVREDSGLPRLGGREYCLGEGHAGAETVLEEVLRENEVDAVVDLTSLEDGTPDSGPGSRSGSQWDDGLLHLVRAHLRSSDHRPLRLLHTARQAPSSPESARIAAAVRSLGAEYGRVRAGSLELEVVPDDALTLMRLVLNELLALEDTPTWSRHRFDGRRTRSYQEVPVPSLELRDGSFGPFPVRGDRLYVVTGGTSGIGLKVAERLVERGVRRIALLGRRPLPAQRDWRDELTRGHPRADTLRTLLRMQELGADVLVHTGPLHERDSVSTFLTHARTRAGGVAGVVHCAGDVPRNATPFVHQETHEVRSSWLAKDEGWGVVADLIEEDSLDFAVLFSSVSASVPALGSGWVAYSGANAFLDAAAIKATQGSNTIIRSIGWASWQAAGAGELHMPAYTAAGLRALTTKDGLDLLERALALDEPHLLATRVTADFSPESMTAHRTTVRSGEPSSLPESSRGAAYVDARERTAVRGAGESRAIQDLEDFLLDVFEQELLVSRQAMSNGASFADLGIDSIFIAGLVPRLEAYVGHPVQPSIVLEHNTVGALAAALAPDRPEAQQPPEDVSAAPAHPFTGEHVVRGAGAAELDTYGLDGAEADVDDDRVAIIGMAGRYPGAPDLSSFWRLLRDGECAVREVPGDRWDAHGLYEHEWRPGAITSRWGGFLDAVDQFDPEHFGIEESAAAYMHPLSRLFLEVGEETFRNAGYTREELAGRRIGVYVGGGTEGYGTGLREPDPSSVTGLNQNFVAAHLAQLLDLRGPNLVVDTACSSSLTALHMGFQALKAGDCDMSLVGGADLLMDAAPYLKLSAAGAMSPDGRCRTFDSRANGIVLGEGGGAVLIKPLRAAVRDGDQILAVVEGAAVNNDGRTMGVTTPSPEAQHDVVDRALRAAGASASSMSYVEAHGTGTLIGDPIELQALSSVFVTSTQDRQYCGIGSVKSNIGHLLRAAGMAGLQKVVLALQHEQIPPTLHCDRPNPRFDFETSPFVPVTSLRPWEPREGVRRASVSAFGFGGTNAHVVLRGPTDAETHRRSPTRAPLAPQTLNRRSFWLDAPSGSRPGVCADRPETRPRTPLRRTPVLALTETSSPIRAR